MLKYILISGLRGFSKEKKVSLALTNGQAGSGLTILVGGNNTGKTTIVEAVNERYCFPNIHLMIWMVQKVSMAV